LWVLGKYVGEVWINGERYSYTYELHPFQTNVIHANYTYIDNRYVIRMEWAPFRNNHDTDELYSIHFSVFSATPFKKGEVFEVCSDDIRDESDNSIGTFKVTGENGQSVFSECRAQITIGDIIFKDKTMSFSFNFTGIRQDDNGDIITYEGTNGSISTFANIDSSISN